jgi:hypothetical protein
MFKIKLTDGNNIKIIYNNKIMSYKDLKEEIGELELITLCDECEMDFNSDKNQFEPDCNDIEYTLECLLENNFKLLSDIETDLEFIYCIDQNLNLIVIESKDYFEKNNILNDRQSNIVRHQLLNIISNIPIYEFAPSRFEIDSDFSINEIEKILKRNNIKYSRNLDNFINS